jgi:FKBP-type peptidyl-prolyl cis-trans isomerase
VAGRTIQVRYSGWLINANRFDSGTIDFSFGVGQVIPGWDQGLVGMKVGGKRKLVIGSALAYGRSGSGPIPPNSTLVFDVELLAVR